MNKKIGVYGAVSTGVGMLIATSCFISLADGTSTVGLPFLFIIILVYHNTCVHCKYVCGSFNC